MRECVRESTLAFFSAMDSRSTVSLSTRFFATFASATVSSASPRWKVTNFCATEMDSSMRT